MYLVVYFRENNTFISLLSILEPPQNTLNLSVHLKLDVAIQL
jgi:hypothetical protein